MYRTIKAGGFSINWNDSSAHSGKTVEKRATGWRGEIGAVINGAKRNTHQLPGEALGRAAFGFETSKE
jgi:hypothetical protein